MNSLRDFTDLLIVMKKAAIEAVNASKPTSIVYGKVINTSPLQINVEQKMTLTAAQLVLTRNVTEHKIQMTVDHVTGNTSGGSGEDSFSSHSHKYSGKKEFTVHNGLVVGDEVVMIQMQGGQKYIVLDRVVKA